MSEPTGIINGQQGTEKRDALFVLFSFITGFLFCELILFGGFGVAVPLFVAVYYVLLFTYLPKQQINFNRDAVITFAAVLLLTSTFVLFDNHRLDVLTLLLIEE